MFKRLRRRCETGRRIAEDAKRLTKANGHGEPLSGPDPIEELVRIVGESEAGERRVRVRPRAVVRSARGNVPRR